MVQVTLVLGNIINLCISRKLTYLIINEITFILVSTLLFIFSSALLLCGSLALLLRHINALLFRDSLDLGYLNIRALVLVFSCGVRHLLSTALLTWFIPAFIFPG